MVGGFLIIEAFWELSLGVISSSFFFFLFLPYGLWGKCNHLAGGGNGTYIHTYRAVRIIVSAATLWLLSQGNKYQAFYKLNLKSLVYFYFLIVYNDCFLLLSSPASIMI